MLARLPAALNSELRHCQELTRRHSKTFYLGSLLLPPRQRAAVWALYAACRAGDDITDGASPVAARRARLQRWDDEIAAAYAGAPARTPVGRALTWAVSAYPVPQRAFAELREGFEMDLRLDSGDFTFETAGELQLYCRRVAGVVGFMVAPVTGYRGGDRTLEQALWLGQAMQLTNVLRDVGEDLGRGRVYLPSELLREFGVRTADLRRGAVTPRHRALMSRLADESRDWYARGRPGIARLRGPSRVGVALAARAYEGILDDLAAAGFDNLSRRAHLRLGRKLRLLPRAVRDSWPQAGMLEPS